MNAHIRDQFRETSPFTVTTAGDLSYADAANSMNSRLGIGAARTFLVSDGSAPTWRVPGAAARTDSATSTNTSYNSLGGAAWYNDSGQVEVEKVTGTGALIMWKARLSNNTVGERTIISYDVTGDTTILESDARRIGYESGAANDDAEFGGFDFITSLNAGTNKFQLQGRVSGGTGSISRPEIFVLPF